MNWPFPAFKTPNPGRAGGIKRTMSMSAGQRSELARMGGEATQRLYGRGYYSALALYGHRVQQQKEQQA